MTTTRSAIRTGADTTRAAARLQRSIGLQLASGSYRLVMPTYRMNPHGVAKARALIDARRYRVRSRWADAQPDTAERNAFLKTHSWEEYSSWHLALSEGPGEDTKARYAFGFGDFSRVHRMGLIACYYRAAEWEHTEVMVAAHKLLLHLDKTRA